MFFFDSIYVDGFFRLIFDEIDPFVAIQQVTQEKGITLREQLHD